MRQVIGVLVFVAACGGDDGDSVTGDCAMLEAELESEDMTACTVTVDDFIFDPREPTCPAVQSDTHAPCTSSGSTFTFSFGQHRLGQRGLLVRSGSSLSTCTFLVCQ